MIRRIFSSISAFKELEFHSGLNILISRKEASATERQTRNRAGKTSVVEIIHFLTGADVKTDSLFRTRALVDHRFGMEFQLGSSFTKVERSCTRPAKIELSSADGISQKKNSEWLELLGSEMFRLPAQSEPGRRVPTFRSLFPYFVRRQLSGGFTTPEKHAIQQQPCDFQMGLLFLLGLDWTIASDWQKVRDREKTLTELRKAASSGALGEIVGRAADLRTALTVSEAKLGETRNRLASFQVLSSYRELEAEADALARRLSELSNGNVLDRAVIRDLETALASEAPPAITELEEIYKEAGIVLPGLAVRRYDEVRSFHESVIQNRRDYLSGELDAAKGRIVGREDERRRLDERRSQVMGMLRSHGALDEFLSLQEEAGRLAAEVQSLRQRFDAAEQLEGTKDELEIERKRLTLRLRRDFAEQRERLSEAILAFEEISQKLYESAGSMTVDETANGPEFRFPMQGSRSKGIKNMQIFCFDMMLMRLGASRGFGPGFLVHDSHLFDGVDGRQVVSALKTGAETAERLGIQYIVTLNEDDAFKERIAGFEVNDYVLPVVLTDAGEDGGLFGFRFD